MAEQRLNSLEINMAEQQKDIKYIKQSLDENKAEHKEILEMLKGWQEESKKRFANRWVEDAIKFVIGIVFLAIIGAILNIIL